MRRQPRAGRDDDLVTMIQSAQSKSHTRSGARRPSPSVSDPSSTTAAPAPFILQINRILQLDPTRTKGIRDAFVRDISRRFRLLKRDIWESIYKNDAMALGNDSPSIKRVTALAAIPIREFEFVNAPGKVSGFQAWLADEVDRGILGVSQGPARGADIWRGGDAWANTYIDSAYKKGMKRGTAELKKLGISVPKPIGPGGFEIDAAFNLPIHADSVAMLYTRAFNELKGITAAMDQTMSRSLAESLAEGRNPRQAARILMNRIEKVGDLAMTDAAGRQIRALTRARTLARTEIIRAHHVATINTYREAGVAGVKVRAEWSTAGDNRVCSSCAGLEGQVFKLDEIYGLIPLHPNCRCVAIPADVGEGKQAAKIEARKKRKRIADAKGVVIPKPPPLLKKTRKEKPPPGRKPKSKRVNRPGVRTSDWRSAVRTPPAQRMVDPRDRSLIAKPPRGRGDAPPPKLLKDPEYRLVTAQHDEVRRWIVKQENRAHVGLLPAQEQLVLKAIQDTEGSFMRHLLMNSSDEVVGAINYNIVEGAMEIKHFGWIGSEEAGAVIQRRLLHQVVNAARLQGAELRVPNIWSWEEAFWEKLGFVKNPGLGANTYFAVGGQLNIIEGEIAAFLNAPIEAAAKAAAKAARVVGRGRKLKGDSSTLASGTVEDEKFLGGGVNDAIKVELKEGNRTVSAVVKFEEGEYPHSSLNWNPEFTAAMREKAVYRMSKKLGFGNVPETEYRTILGTSKKGKASVQKFHPNSDIASRTSSTIRNKLTDEDRFESGLFDFIAAASDRHGNNWMITKGRKPKIVMIDNGYAFTPHMEQSLIYNGDFVEMLTRVKVSPEHVAKIVTKLKKFDVHKFAKETREWGGKMNDGAELALEARRRIAIKILEDDSLGSIGKRIKLLGDWAADAKPPSVEFELFVDEMVDKLKGKIKKPRER